MAGRKTLLQHGIFTSDRAKRGGLGRIAGAGSRLGTAWERNRTKAFTRLRGHIPKPSRAASLEAALGHRLVGSSTGPAQSKLASLIPFRQDRPSAR
jgi:hypothetical protein